MTINILTVPCTFIILKFYNKLNYAKENSIFQINRCLFSVF